MNDQIGDFENPQIFPSEENLLGFRRRLSFPFSQGTMPASGLQTVLSITQSAHSNKHQAPGAIRVMEWLSTRKDEMLGKSVRAVSGEQQK